MAIRFRLLGPLDLTVDGRAIILNGTKRRPLVGRLLVARGAVVPVEQLVDDLWAGEPPDGAVKTLRTYISKLRTIMGDEVLVTGAGGYALDLRKAELDADEFEEVLLDLRAGQLPAERVDRLRAALRLWRGAALGELAHEPWAMAEAARLEQLRVTAVEECLELELALGRTGAVLGELAVLTNQHPYREGLWALLARALFRNAQRTEALRAVQRARQQLADAGLDLGTELVLLEKQLLDQDPALLDPGPGAGPGTPPPGWVTTVGPPLVGRDGEQEEVLSWTLAGAANSRRLLLIEGEPGIGKTRLAVEVAHRLRQEGALVLFGRCDDEASGPYQPFAEATGPAGDNGGPAPGAGTLAALGEGSPGDAESDRLRFFDTVEQRLARLSGDRLVVLLIDDLQWADHESLSLLRHLMRGRAGGRLAIVATHRRNRYESFGPVHQALGDMRRWATMRRLGLPGLDDDHVVTILERRLERPATGAERRLAARLRADTAGNPFFVTAVVDHLVESGQLGAATPEGRVVIPDAVADVVRARLAQLPTETQRIRVTAAVVGPTFEATVVADALGGDEGVLVEAMEQAMGAHFVQPSGEAGLVGDSYQFSHALVREVLYETLSPSRRVRAHRDVALALERQGGNRTGPRLRQLALHFAKAAGIGFWPQAMDYAERAGHEAADQLAYERAAELFDVALTAAERVCPDDRWARARLLIALGSAQVRADRHQEGRRALAVAAAEARVLGDGELLAQAALRAAGPFTIGTETDAEAVGLLGDAADANPGPTPTRALLLARLGQSLYRRAPMAERVVLSDEAVAIAEDHGRPAVLARVLVQRFWSLYSPDAAAERVDIAERLWALAQDLDDRELTLQAAQCHTHLWLELGDHQAVRRYAATRAALAAELNQPYYHWFSQVHEAMVLANRGEFDEAERRAREACDLRSATNPEHAMQSYLALVYQCRWLQRRLSEVRETIELLLERDGDRAVWRGALLAACVETGDTDGARALLDWLRPDGYARIERDFDWWATVGGVAIAGAHLGDPALAAEAYDLVAPYRGRNSAIGQSAFFGAVDHHLGLLALAAGRPEVAVTHLEAAVARHVDMEAPPFEALSRHALGRALAARGAAGDGERAGHEQATAALVARRIAFTGLDALAVGP